MSARQREKRGRRHQHFADRYRCHCVPTCKIREHAAPRPERLLELMIDELNADRGAGR